jgi:hypothetical protein
MHAKSVVASLLTILSLAACGSNEPTGPAPLANGTYRARIDGAEFNAISAAVIGGVGGLYSLGGGNAAGQTVGFAWLDTGTGTYPIGGATVATYTHMGQTWSASSAQGSGSIVVTTTSANRVAGTFSFVLQADAASGATGTRTVTEGSFDLTY